jgi:hypothetical protein
VAADQVTQSAKRIEHHISSDQPLFSTRLFCAL